MTRKNKKRRETSILRELKIQLTTKAKRTLPLFAGYYFALFIVYLLCMILLSTVAAQIAPYQNVLLNDIKPAMITSGELNDAQALQLIAFGEVLDGIIVKTILIVFFFVLGMTILRLIRDYLLWQQLKTHKLKPIALLKLMGVLAVIGVVAIFLIFFTLKTINNVALLLTLWLLIYILCETAFLFVLGSKMTHKRKRHAPHILPLLFVNVLLITLIFIIGLALLFVIISFLSFLPQLLFLIIMLLVLFFACVKRDVLKLIIAKRLFEREVHK